MFGRLFRYQTNSTVIVTSQLEMGTGRATATKPGESHGYREDLLGVSKSSVSSGRRMVFGFTLS